MANTRPAVTSLLVLAAFCLVTCVEGRASAVDRGTQRLALTPPQRKSNGAVQGRVPIGYMGNTGRNGHYYLPPRWKNRQRPIMILLHGSGMSGLSMVQRLSWLADKYQFIIVAPDSSNSMYWFTTSAKQKRLSADWYHVQASYNYVKRIAGVRINPRRVVYAGFSRGGYSAAGLASRTKSATHALVIHSSLLTSQLGGHVVKMRFSTGTEDPMFSPSTMRQRISGFKREKSWFPMSLRIYKGGHSLNCPGELEADVRWWLGKGP